MQGPIAASRRALALALALLGQHAAALELGEIEVRSSLGDPLDARVPLTLASGEYVEGSCFSLRSPPTGLPTVADGILSVHTSPGGRKALRIRSRSPQVEPALGLSVRGACRGLAAEATRDFVLLIDPPQRAPRPRMQPAEAPKATPAPGRADPPRSPARPARPPEIPGLHERPAAAPAPAALAPKPQRAPAPGIAAPKSAEPAAVPRARPDFVLKLSSPSVDLSRSRGIDDRTRQRLRERQLVLDADDHVSALLALRHSVRRLESQVAELQLKLTTAPPRVEASRAEPPKAGAPKPEAARPPLAAPVRIDAAALARADAQPAAPTLRDAPRISAAPPEPAKPELPKAETPKPSAASLEPPKAAEAAKPPKPPPVSPLAVKPAKTAPEATSWLDRIPNVTLYALLAIVLLLLLGAIAWWMGRRRQARSTVAEDAAPVQDSGASMEPELAARDLEEALAARAVGRVSAPAATPPATPPADASRAEAASDAGLSTRLPDNSRELRRRYIEERFPEIANRTLRLDDPASVIKAARLYYSDGGFARAVELLQFCIEDRPGEVRFWLALFEIFRLERLAGEYAQLAERFKARHGASESWRKVQHFGREIDPGNPLYREEPMDTLQTIGPGQARRLSKPAPVDPIVENWLEAPMDFENEVLANELRRKLMAQARLTDQDLAPDTRRVLRSSDIFQVA